MESIESHSSKDVNTQATLFLERYLFDFQDSFEEVLDLAEDFKRRSDDSLRVSEDDFCQLSNSVSGTRRGKEEKKKEKKENETHASLSGSIL